METLGLQTNNMKMGGQLAKTMKNRKEKCTTTSEGEQHRALFLEGGPIQNEAELKLSRPQQRGREREVDTSRDTGRRARCA